MSACEILFCRSETSCALACVLVSAIGIILVEIGANVGVVTVCELLGVLNIGARIGTIELAIEAAIGTIFAVTGTGVSAETRAFLGMGFSRKRFVLYTAGGLSLR